MNLNKILLVVVGIAALALLVPTTTMTTTTTTTTTNATAAAPANATNTTGIITALIWHPGDEPDPTSGLGGEEVVQLSPANIQYQQTDLGFAKLVQTTADCLSHFNEISDKLEADPNYITGGSASERGEISEYAQDAQRQDLCTDVINQDVAQFCESTDFATFDIAKCEEARLTTDRYLGVAEVLYG
jgi:hypothetical protein